jgi:hypothetical protein
VFKSDEDQFAIVIPQGMDDVDLTRGDIDQILNQLEANNPSFASVGPQVRSVLASGGKLFAIDSSTAATTGFADNVNLIAVAGESDVTNPSVESQIRTQLEGIPANDLVFNSGDVNGRPVLSASYTATVNGADGQPRTVFGRQAYFSADGKTWVLTYTTGAEDTSDTLGTMVQSFTVND